MGKVLRNIVVSKNPSPGIMISEGQELRRQARRCIQRGGKVTIMCKDSESKAPKRGTISTVN